jgi:hypothetical protein
LSYRPARKRESLAYAFLAPRRVEQ